MPDETIETTDETTETEAAPVGSDTQTAEGGSEETGDNTDSPSEPGKIPYERFKQVNDQKRDLEAQLAAVRERELRDLANQRQAQEAAAEPVFDDDTDQRLQRWYESQKAKDPDFQATRKLRDDWERDQLRRANPDYDEFEPQLNEFDARLQRGELTPREARQVVLDAIRYRSGKPQQKAAEAAAQRNESKARAAGPSGSVAGADPEGIDLDNANLDQLIADMRAGKNINW